ncbi:MAG TPA: hypothetical protein PKD78_01020, partial [Saprospiraceae bacterium]|nr:hypothetical protein [Saprospiraceae bacterium]
MLQLPLNTGDPTRYTACAEVGAPVSSHKVGFPTGWQAQPLGCLIRFQDTGGIECSIQIVLSNFGCGFLSHA